MSFKDNLFHVFENYALVQNIFNIKCYFIFTVQKFSSCEMVIRLNYWKKTKKQTNRKQAESKAQYKIIKKMIIFNFKNYDLR